MGVAGVPWYEARRDPIGRAHDAASTGEFPRVGGDPLRCDLLVEIMDVPGTRCSASSSPTVGGMEKVKDTER
jgi:hypothetical protein